MPLEFTIPHSLSDVQSAAMQFAARRGLRLTQPGHVEGLCIEDASLPTPARVEVRLQRCDGGTTGSLSFGENPESVQLAYALRCYLADDRAFECECPPICPACSASVANIKARYCALCGKALLGKPAQTVRVE